MSEVVGEGVIRIRTDESGVDVDSAGREAGKGYARGFTAPLKGIAVAIGGVLAARTVLDFAKQSIAEGREAQKVEAATQQIIKATGGTANTTAAQIGDLTSALSAKSGMDDELIQSGANLILTFKNVANAGKGTNAIFDRATAAAVDLSAAGFGSVTGASLQLGKALNDPVKGISALARAGVTFTAQQQAQIKAMVASGNILGAQKIVLKEVEGQVGGVAAATATAGEKATVAWGNIKEAVGTALIPVLDTLLGFFVDKITPGIFKLIAATSGLGPVFSSIGKVIAGVFSGPAASGASGFFDTIKGAVAGVIPKLVAGFLAVLPSVLQFFGALKDGAATVLPVMQDTFVNKLLPAIQALVGYVSANLVPVFSQVVGVIAHDVVPLLAQLAVIFYGTVYPAVIAIVSVVATKLRPVFDQLVTTFRTQVLPTVEKLINQIRGQLIPALQPIIARVIQVIGFFVKLAATILGVVLPPLIRIAGFIISNVVPVIAALVIGVVKIIGKIIEFGAAVISAGKFIAGLVGKFIDLERRGIDAVVHAISELPGRILALGGKMLSAGKSIIGKFIQGLKGAGSLVSDIAGNVWNALRGLINSAIDKLNAALSFTISLPGPDLTINAPDIGHLATGTSSWRGGLTWVGEQGPELVRLPRGSQVWTAQESAAMGSGGGTTINIASIMPHNYSEFERQLLDQQRLAALGGRRPPR